MTNSHKINITVVSKWFIIMLGETVVQYTNSDWFEFCWVKNN